MFSVTAQATPGCTAQSEPQRETSRRLSYFQVNEKFHRYWSGNQIVNDEGKLENQLRFCPFDFAEIEYDERGHAHCLECGTIFPLPKTVLPKTDRTKAYENRKFMEQYRAGFMVEVEDGVRDRNTKGVQSQPQADPEPATDTKATGRRVSYRATSRY
jgi:hypothetical protein